MGGGPPHSRATSRIMPHPGCCGSARVTYTLTSTIHQPPPSPAARCTFALTFYVCCPGHPRARSSSYCLLASPFGTSIQSPLSSLPRPPPSRLRHWRRSRAWHLRPRSSETDCARTGATSVGQPLSSRPVPISCTPSGPFGTTDLDRKEIHLYPLPRGSRFVSSFRTSKLPFAELCHWESRVPRRCRDDNLYHRHSVSN